MADNANQRIIDRITAVEPDLQGEDANVLGYIKQALSPEAVAARHDEDKSVVHLHQVAHERLRPYERARPTSIPETEEVAA